MAKQSSRTPKSSRRQPKRKQAEAAVAPVEATPQGRADDFLDEARISTYRAGSLVWGAYKLLADLPGLSVEQQEWAAAVHAALDCTSEALHKALEALDGMEGYLRRA